jgi:hypothetical protein
MVMTTQRQRMTIDLALPDADGGKKEKASTWTTIPPFDRRTRIPVSMA